MRRFLIALSGLLLLAATTAGPVAAAPPANDLPAGALAVTLPLPFQQTLDTTEATVTTDDVGCGAGGVDQATVWYTITPTSDMRIVIDASASSYLTGVNAFFGAPTGENIIACAYDAVIIDAAAGTTYYIMIADADENGINGGTLNLSVDLAPPPPELELTIDGIGKLDAKSGVVTVTGTLTCSTDLEFGELFVIVRQPVGRLTISGGSFSEAGCSAGDPVPWSVSVSGENGKFAGGRTTVEASFFGCTLSDCVEAFASQSIKLRH